MNEGSVDDYVVELIDVIVESLQDEYRSDIEPFDRYEKRIRLQLFHDIKAYCERFQSGYDAIIKEIEDEQKG